MKRHLPLLTIPALFLAGCASGSGPGAGGAAPPASPAPATSSPAPSPSPTTTSTGTPRCHTKDLELSLGGSEGAAGTAYRALLFTNTSGHRCTLYGYPGVSWVTGDNGTQVNAPFRRDAVDKAVKVTLAPAAVAHAVLAAAHPEAFPSGDCKPIAVRGYRVYPPDETAAVFVADPGTACSVPGVNRGRVTVITPGDVL